tara:strand:- start:7 stop:339 length:333 start_codon:yes stop_codon:yes gene_type:complete
MLVKKSHGIRIGFSTILSLIIAYILNKIATENGWTFLALITKIYLLFYLIIGIIIVGIIVLILIFLFISLFIFRKNIRIFKNFNLNKNSKKKQKDNKTKEYIDAEYKIIK